MPNIVKYGSFDANEAEKQAKEFESSSAFFKIPEGRTVTRALPPKAGKKSPIKLVNQHRMTIGDKILVFLCPGSLECPACAQWEVLRKSRNESEREFAREVFSPRQCAYMNVIDRANPEKGPQVWSFGKTIFSEIISIRNDPESGGDFTDPVNGFDLIIRRKGVTRNDTRYKILPARERTALGDMSWIETQLDLDEFVINKTIDEIEDLVAEVESGGFEPHESKAPMRRTEAPALKAKPRARNIQEDISDADYEEDISL
jgi:hypothetical protein